MTSRVTICRATRQAGPLIAELKQAGHTVIELPLLEIVAPRDGGDALRDAVDRLGDFSWVAFTSANAVSSFVSAMGERPWPPSVQRAAVGIATGRALIDLGLSVDVVASPATAADLANQLPLEPSDLVLAPLGELAGHDLVDGIRARGASVERIDAYATVAPVHSPDAIAGALDAELVLLTAPSVVDRLVELADGRQIPPGVCIGPRTAERAITLGLTIAAVADPHDDEGLLAAVAMLTSAD